MFYLFISFRTDMSLVIIELSDNTILLPIHLSTQNLHSFNIFIRIVMHVLAKFMIRLVG